MTCDSNVIKSRQSFYLIVAYGIRHTAGDVRSTPTVYFANVRIEKQLSQDKITSIIETPT